MDKEFGKFTADQLLELLQWLPVVDDLAVEMRQAFVANPETLAKHAPNGLRWVDAYETDYQSMLAELTMLIGQSAFIAQAGNSADPQQAILDDLAASEDGAGFDPSADMPPENLPRLIGLVLAVVHNLECVALFGRYLNELIADASERGATSDKSLFNAIRIDQSIVSGPTAAKRISQAVIEQDGRFFHELGLALEGKTGDQCAYLKDLRYAMKALAESGALNGSPTVLARRLVELRIYPPVPGAEKNAAELIRKYKKLLAI